MLLAAVRYIVTRRWCGVSFCCCFLSRSSNARIGLSHSTTTGRSLLIDRGVTTSVYAAVFSWSDTDRHNICHLPISSSDSPPDWKPALIAAHLPADAASKKSRKKSSPIITDKQLRLLHLSASWSLNANNRWRSWYWPSVHQLAPTSNFALELYEAWWPWPFTSPDFKSQANVTETKMSTKRKLPATLYSCLSTVRLHIEIRFSYICVAI